MSLAIIHYPLQLQLAECLSTRSTTMRTGKQCCRPHMYPKGSIHKVNRPYSNQSDRGSTKVSQPSHTPRPGLFHGETEIICYRHCLSSSSCRISSLELPSRPISRNTRLHYAHLLRGKYRCRCYLYHYFEWIARIQRLRYFVG